MSSNRLIFELQESLGISDQYMSYILGMTPTEFERCKHHNFTLDAYSNRKVELLLDIEQHLTDMFVTDKQKRTWMKTKHPELKGVPLEMLGDTAECLRLKDYLEGVANMDLDDDASALGNC